MTQTYVQLHRQISDLETNAREMKEADIADLAARIRDAVSVYGVTASELLALAGVGGTTTQNKAGKTSKATSKALDEPKYRDGKGNVWVGRGPRPLWLRDALAAGKSLDDFAAGAVPAAATSKQPFAAEVAPMKKAANGRKAAAKKGSGQVRFQDSEGNKWSGFGPKPAWLKAAIAAGKTAEDFAV